MAETGTINRLQKFGPNFSLACNASLAPVLSGTKFWHRLEMMLYSFIHSLISGMHYYE